MKTLAEIYRKKFRFGGNDWTGIGTPEDEWSGMASDTASSNTVNPSFNTPATSGILSTNNGGNNFASGTGGGTPSGNQATGALFGSVGTLIESNPKNKQAITGTYASGQGAIVGASKGAQMGSAVGPWGTIIGAGVGGIYGYVKGKRKKKKEKKAIAALDSERNRDYSTWSQARLANNPNYQVGDRNAEMYKKGGKLKKVSNPAPFVYKPTTTPSEVPFSNLTTTEYNEPNMPPPMIDPFVNTLYQTVLDQSEIGKGYNLANSANDFRKKKSLGTATNLGAEFIKLGVPVVGDAVVNLGQEVVDSYDNPKPFIGMPGNASQGPVRTQQSKARPHYEVPISSSTFVQKPLIRENGGELKRRYQAKFTDYTGTQIMKTGGPVLSNVKTIGGSMTPMSKDTTLASGPSHEQGGIELPNQGAELEGGETSSGDYIFSKALGFAQLHKPIARAEGKIQNKPATAERMKSLSLLKNRTEQLKVTQEMVKQHLNLQ